MNSNALQRRMHPCAPRLALMFAMALASTTSAQGAISPTVRIYNESGRVVGFETNEPEAYFLIPEVYLLARRDSPPPAYLTPAGQGPDGQALYDLRLVFTPSYAHASAAVARIRAAHPRALFFPLPMSIGEVTLFLPDVLGTVAARLTPDDGLSTPFALYYRLRLSSSQVAVLQALARSGLALQGVVGTTYAVPGGEQSSSVPITLLLPASTFSSTLPPQTQQPEQWLQDLLEETQLSVPGALDGRYPLGGGISVTLRDSTISGLLRPGAFRVQAVSNGEWALAATASPNLHGQVRVYVAELGFWVVLSYQAAFEARLDLSMMEVQLTRFDLTSVQVDGTDSPFHRRMLTELMRRPETQQQLAAALTRELQERILAHALFGVELP